MSRPAPAVDLSFPRRIHLVGVGGAGMSAIASVLAAMGHVVTGSDLKTSPTLARLGPAGVAVSVGHSARNVGTAEVVASSTAVPGSNAELSAARERGIPVLSRAEVLSAIAATRRTVAVAGTHGKTTTSSMLALVMGEAGLRPSFIIGGELNEIGTGAVWSDGAWLVVEADESDGTFLALTPEVGVVTSVEADHIEHYGSLAGLESAFDSFLAGVGGSGVVCADYEVTARMAMSHGAITYGTSSSAAWRIVEAEGDRSSTSFALEHDGARTPRFSIPVPGMLNVRNATAAIVTGHCVGVEMDAARAALARFGGVARRFQFRGSREGVTFVDDYAHLPGEVAGVLEAAAQGMWERIVCVFQPHRFSRTEALWADFADSFRGADVVLVMDVYPAGELPRLGVSGQLVADAVRQAHPSAALEYLPTRQEVRARLEQILRRGDLCLLLGAGDIATLADDLFGGGVA